MAAGEMTARRDPVSGDHGGLSGWPLKSAFCLAIPSSSQWNVFPYSESPGLVVPAIRKLSVTENRWRINRSQCRTNSPRLRMRSALS